MEDSIRLALFESVASADYERLVKIFAADGRDALVAHCLWGSDACMAGE